MDDRYANLDGSDTITGLWSFAHALGLKTDTITERTLNAGISIDSLLIKDGVIPNTGYPNALLLDGTRAMVGHLQLEKTAYYDEEYDNGTKSSNYELDWNNGNKQKLTLGANITLTFTNPLGACNLVLNLVQDGTGNRTVTWDTDIKWSADTAPTLSTGSGDIDILTFYFDGTYYYGAFMGDFV